ncbi:hypothetical protein [Legionella gresilensis]|uniref:hypothetical protein n=1 Tax=Legionella gresilensis TaxID=91823 RepID=UPI001040E249|nr:hypothetical protein [Legionella gresilensis]
MWYPQFQFKLKANNANYINALAALYPNHPIQELSINGEVLPYSERTLQELNIILNELRESMVKH